MKKSTVNLNDEQRHASMSLWQENFSALQVIAGAGSGKTTTLAAAVLAARDAGFAPSDIAVITFSRRAAHELKERFASQSITVGYCGTMHALAWRLLRARGLQKKLILHSARERARIARDLFPEFAHVPPKIVLRAGFLTATQRQILDQEYASWLETKHGIDFDGMIAQATAQEAGRDKYTVVFVDEFQDTSPDQVDFIRSLNAQKLFVVGDDWQSIYRFRGADVTITRDFTTHFTNARRVYLTQNYRSGEAIVKLGNKAIRLSSVYVRKALKANHPTEKKPRLFFASDADNARTVWAYFLQYIERNRRRNELSEFTEEKVTVLVRTNAIRLALEKNRPENFEILTIHKSKGLEFNNVIVFGVAEHILPHRENDFDEEVRILYVALTRARKTLSFVAWEKQASRSLFLPFLMRNCHLIYL